MNTVIFGQLSPEKPNVGKLVQQMRVLYLSSKWKVHLQESDEQRKICKQLAEFFWTFQTNFRPSRWPPSPSVSSSMTALCSLSLDCVILRGGGLAVDQLTLPFIFQTFALPITESSLLLLQPCLYNLTHWNRILLLQNQFPSRTESVPGLNSKWPSSFFL